MRRESWAGNKFYSKKEWSTIFEQMLRLRRVMESKRGVEFVSSVLSRWKGVKLLLGGSRVSTRVEVASDRSNG